MIARTVIDFKDRATPDLARKISALQPEKLARVVGPKLRVVTRDHLKRNPRNKKGWPSTGFWEDAARSVTWESDAVSVTIRINKLGVSQRYYGGVIQAVTAKFLTIPISAQAYGKTVADFPGSFLIRTPKGAYIVQYAGGNTAKGKFKKQNATLEFLFKLKRSVKQEENRSVIPDAITYTAVALDAIADYFRQVKAGGIT